VSDPVLQMHRAYIASAAALFEESTRLANEKTRAFLARFAHGFPRWVGPVLREK